MKFDEVEEATTNLTLNKFPSSESRFYVSKKKVIDTILDRI